MNDSPFKKAAVIGFPLLHTLSPKLHGYWLNKYNISGEYHAVPVDPARLRDDVFKLRDAGYVGFNVTIPHKETIMNLCDDISVEAQKIGAVNTVLFHPSGRIEGRNTDAFGFITHARKAIDGLDVTRPMVLGAGGAARAILYALKQAGAQEILIVNRTIDRARALASEFDARVVDWSEKDDYLNDRSFLINTTSCGMVGQAALDIDISKLAANAVVYDIVYKPLMTDLLRAAQSRNLRIITGLGMLMYQAVPAFELFFGVQPVVDDSLQNYLLSE